MSAERDAEWEAAFERLDKQLTELRAKIDAHLASVIQQGEELVRLLEAERRARAELNAHIMPPAHD